MKIEYEINKDKSIDGCFRYREDRAIKDAIYMPAINATDRGNPFIEALPYPLDNEKINMKYYTPCGIKPDIKKDIEEQLFDVDFFEDIRIPLPFMKDIERLMYSSITRSYRLRFNDAVFAPSLIYSNNSEDSQSISHLVPLEGDSGNGFALLGIGGCGKSNAVTAMLKRYPQVIRHRFPQGEYKQIVWIKIDAPQQSNISDLYQIIAQEIDTILGNTEPLYEKLLQKQKDFGMKGRFIANLIRQFSIGTIILDEIQNFSSIRKGSMDTIVQIINSTKVVLMFVGTEKAYYSLLKEYYVARRFGVMLDANQYCSDLEQFKKTIRFITSINWFEPNSFQLTNSIVEALYEETHGVISRIITLWMDIQKDYISSTPKPEISATYIKQVSNKTRPLMGTFTGMVLDQSPLAEIKPEVGEDVFIKVDRAKQICNNIYGSLNETGRPLDAQEVLKKVKEYTLISGKSYNDTTLVNAVNVVMKRKSSADLDVMDLTKKVISKLGKISSDKRQ